MLGYVCIGMLAAFGLMCAVWILCGLLVREGSGGQLIYVGGDVRQFAQRYLWLREMGLIRCPLAVTGADDALRPWLEGQGIEIYSRRELAHRLGIGAEEN